MRRQRISADFKTGFWKGCCTPTYVPIFSWGFGQHILRKIIRKPRICYERWSNSAQSIALAQSIARMGFSVKKAQLECRYNVYFSVWWTCKSLLSEYQKINGIFFSFLTYKLLFVKNRFLTYFRRRHVEAAASNFRRLRYPNLKGHWHRYLWLKFTMFSLMNNWKIKRTKRKFKKTAFWGPIPCSFGDLL